VLAAPSRRFIAGFEGADHVNASGVALDMVAMSGHLQRLDEDYRRVAQAGFGAVRESIGWRLAEDRDGRIDLTRTLRMAECARRHGLAVHWTLMHYGVPPGVSLYDDALIERFARFARSVAQSLRGSGDAPLLYTPVNEIGFLAWAAGQTDVLVQTPRGADTRDPLTTGYDVKRRLARATLAALDAMRAEDASLRFMPVEPLVHVAPGEPGPACEAHAALVASWQWQAVDLLTGRLEPECGGRDDVVDVLGVNHYPSSQWEVPSLRHLRWHEDDLRWQPLDVLLERAFERYRKPLLISETGHVGIGRADWWRDVMRAVQRTSAPVEGVTLYPVVDRPDWAEPERWHRCGLWHVLHDAPGRLARARVAHRPLRDAIVASQRRFG
jgi:hypothetical protein